MWVPSIRFVWCWWVFSKWAEGGWKVNEIGVSRSGLEPSRKTDARTPSVSFIIVVLLVWCVRLGFWGSEDDNCSKCELVWR